MKKYNTKWQELRKTTFKIPVEQIKTLDQIKLKTGKNRSEIIRILIEDLGSEEIEVIVNNHKKER